MSKQANMLRRESPGTLEKNMKRDQSLEHIKVNEIEVLRQSYRNPSFLFSNQ